MSKYTVTEHIVLILVVSLGTQLRMHIHIYIHVIMQREKCITNVTKVLHFPTRHTMRTVGFEMYRNDFC